MANKKIQIKNTAGDNLFPVTKKQCIDDFAHAHSFTGNSITPSGTITLSRSANVALSTTSIGQITGVGSLPTRESKTVVTSAINGASATFTGTVDAGSNATSTGGTEYLEDATITGGGVTPTISYMHWSAGSTPTAGAVNVVTGVSGGGGSRTLSYLHYSAPTATNGSYTPAGSVTLSRSTDVALSTSTISQITGVGTLPTRSSFTYNTLTVSGSTLCVASASAYQITGVGTLPEKAPVSVATGVQTQPNFSGSFAGTATTVVTGISGGSLTANATASGGIKVVSDAAFTNASAATSTIYQITGVGTNPSLTFNSTSSGGQSYVTNVTHTSPSLSKTTKYLHPTITGSVSITTTIAPTTTVSSITGVGTLPTVSTVTIATGVSTQPNFTATFSGDAVTPTGTVGGVQDDPEDPKVHVNTGTFDPTSDDPAGQKSTAEALVSKDEYYATYALYRFADTTFMHQYEFNAAIKNFLSATRIDGMFANARFVWKNNALIIPSFKNRIDSSFRAFSFASDSNCFSLTFRDNAFNGHAFFQNAVSLTSIAVADGADVKIFGYADYCFAGCTKLVEIGAFDLSEVTNLNGAFTYNNNLKHIHLKNIPVSFDISASTKFEESDLMEILNNLMDLTGKTSQTLTMGSTNLAKLTDAEKAIATNKNWALA